MRGCSRTGGMKWQCELTRTRGPHCRAPSRSGNMGCRWGTTDKQSGAVDPPAQRTDHMMPIVWLFQVSADGHGIQVKKPKNFAQLAESTRFPGSAVGPRAIQSGTDTTSPPARVASAGIMGSAE